jgi:hypothetical protein
MTKTYLAARRAYKQGQFPALRVVQESGSYAWIEENGVGLECFATVQAATAHLEAEKAKAAKWIA